MYCVKCGKPTNGDDELCEECKAAEAATVVNSEPVVQKKPGVSMAAFGKALASIIMGFGVFIISSVLNSSGARMHLVAMILMTVIDVAVIAVGIFLGAKAIHTYSAASKTDDKKPLPAFILGLIGVVLAGIATVMIIVFLFVGLPDIVAYYQ